MARRRADDELAPSLALAMRELRDEFRADYNIGDDTRFMPRPRGVASAGSGADYHYRSEPRFLRGIERARHYDRNDMVVGQGVDRLCDNLLQTGYNLEPQTPDPELNTQLEAGFWDWADDPDQCDLQGEKCFADFEHLTLRHTIVDGDILAFLLDVGSLDCAEAHRLRTPAYYRNKLVHGVRLDPETRKRTQYFVSNEEIDPISAVTRNDKFTPYAARDEHGDRHVLHIYDPKRMSQTRGVTALAPIGEVVGMHGDVQFATMVKAQVAAAYAILEEYDVDSRPPPVGTTIVTGATTTETQSDGTTRTSQGIGPGMRVRGAPGAKLKGFAPNIPNPEFFPHTMMLLTFIAINLKMPVHMLLLDPSKTNFSSWRGAIDQARITFRRIHRWHIRKFHAPVYRWRLKHMLAKDPALRTAAKKHGKLFFAHAWHPDAWQYIEPNKDASADLLQLANLMMSDRRRAMRMGYQFSVHRREVIEDRLSWIVDGQKAADAFNAAHGISEKPKPLSWRDICPLPMPQGITATLATEDEPAESPEEVKPADDKAKPSKPSTSED